MAKFTKQEQEKILAKCQGIKRAIENTPGLKETFDAWQNFIRLPFSEQQRIRQEWEDYYIACRATNAALIFQEMNKAQKAGDMEKFRDLARTAKELREQGLVDEIKKPNSFDPNIFDYGEIIKMWKDADKRAKEISGYPDDFQTQNY